MLIPALDRASNILQATPELFTMPAPTMETLATWVFTSMDWKPMYSRFSSRMALASSASLRATVKLMSLLLSRPMD